jgi:anti-anti-sigma regulatory factor
MSFRKNENAELIYYSYVKEDQKDYENFKRELNNATGIDKKLKDIVIDFSGADTINSLEIGVLVRLLQAIQGSSRMLRLIVSPEVIKTLSATNILKLKNLVVYDNQKSFFDGLAKMTKQ